MINPWLLLGALLAFVAAVTGALFYGQNIGTESERVKWQARENAELTAANSRIIELTETARALESEHAVQLASISAKYQEDLQREKTAADRVISDLRDGSRKLRIPVARPVEACRGEAGTAPAAASGRNGEATAELSGEAAAFLVGLASEADAVVHQLTACQRVIMQDRNQAESEVK